MIRVYVPDPATGQLVYRFRPKYTALGLLAQGESIDALIDRAIEKLPKDANGFVIEAAVTPDVITIATGWRFKGDWTVSVGADFRKDGTPAGHVEVVHSWN